MTGLQRPTGGQAPGDPGHLNRRSSVPLYYQLQELLKEKIESEVWRPGDLLPSEPELASQFGVSRIVVRQALAILEDDRQIIRVRGRGTLVAAPKLSYNISGLSRMLLVPRNRELTIQVLDNQVLEVESGMRNRLAATVEEDILRITTLLMLRRKPLAITYSYFRRGRARWLGDVIRPGRVLPADLTLAALDVTLSRSELSIETSQCGQFEADRFGISHRSPVFLALCREFDRTDAGDIPFEVARVECRGDILRIRFDMEHGPQENGLRAIVSPTR
jgi:GntR family transcriptional regulator